MTQQTRIAARHKANLAGDRLRDLRFAQRGLLGAAHLARKHFTAEQLTTIAALAEVLTPILADASDEKARLDAEVERLVR